MTTITFEGVTKRYRDGTVAVRDLNLEVSRGELLVLVGPSGCGKTTALRMIAGLEDITEGKLLIDGQVVNDRPSRLRDIAMVFQNYALYPHMTVRRNMGFGLHIKKVPRAEIFRRVDEGAAILDLVEHLERRPRELSGGQRQRVAMGRAIVREPLAFLMDEPLSNLDAMLRVQMRTQLARLQRRLAATTVYVTHDQTEAMTLGDRVVVLRGGRIQQIDTPLGLYARPANLFVASFIGSPAMNLIPAEADGEELQTPLGRIPLNAEHRRALQRRGRGALVIGIRPEAFEDAELVGERRSRGITLTASVDVLEPMGSETYAYFPLAAGGAPARVTRVKEEVAEDELPADEATQIVARLDPATKASVGAPMSLWFDPTAVHLFDPDTGRRLGG